MINWNRVKDLHNEVGAEDFDEIVELFLEEVESVVSRLRNLQDQSALAEDLHFLQGSAVSIGFSQFADLCRTGEAAANKGQTGDVDLEQISSIFEVSKTEFLAGLNQLNAA